MFVLSFHAIVVIIVPEKQNTKTKTQTSAKSNNAQITEDCILRNNVGVSLKFEEGS